MNGHKSDFRKFCSGTCNKLDNIELYRHLKLHNVNDFKIQIVDQLDLTSEISLEQQNLALDKKEREWIWKLDSLFPLGLNIDNGFYSQNKKNRRTRLQ